MTAIEIQKPFRTQAATSGQHGVIKRLFIPRVGPTMSRGFTIVELLIVIVIIGILAGIVVVSFRGIQDRAFKAKAETATAQIIRVLELYKIQHGDYPDTSSIVTTIGWKDVCVGESSHYPATERMPQDVCVTTSSGTVVSSVNESFNEWMREEISSLPDGSFPTQDVGGWVTRGLTYGYHKAASGGRPTLSYRLKGNQWECLPGFNRSYSNVGNYTSCYRYLDV